MIRRAREARRATTAPRSASAGTGTELFATVTGIRTPTTLASSKEPRSRIVKTNIQATSRCHHYFWGFSRLHRPSKLRRSFTKNQNATASATFSIASHCKISSSQQQPLTASPTNTMKASPSLSPTLAPIGDDGLDFAAFDEDLTPLPEYKPAGDAALDFGGLLPAPLKVHEDLTSGCGGQTWPAGMVLARHMLRYHRNNIPDARILEIGAGGGLVGLAVAKGCTVNQPLYVTDQLEMLSLMGHNIVLNEVEGRVKAMILNWGEALPEEIVQVKPDIILAADCVYFEPAFPLLLQTLKDLLALCPTATIYFCFKKRRRADMQFLKNARKAFTITELPDDDRPIFSRQGLFLYAFTSKSQSNGNAKTNP